MRRWWLVPVVVAATLMTGACSDKAVERDVETVASLSASPTGGPVGGEQAEFRACMKDNDVDLEASAGDGQSINGNSGVINGEITGSRSVEQQRKELRALEKCRQYLPNGGNPQPLSPEELEQARAFAKCMRAAGTDYPDPDPKSIGNGTRAIPPDVDINDPAVLATFRTCQRETSIAAATPGTGS